MLPTDLVQSVRERFLRIVAEAGWLKNNTLIDRAVVEPGAFCVEPEPSFMAVLNRQFPVHELHALQQHPDPVQRERANTALKRLGMLRD